MNLGTPSLPPHVKDRLCRKEVLVVLDDVNDSEQLQVLVGDRDLFGRKSRIIVTTRDAKVLKNIGADEPYKVEPLKHDEALQLFKSKAFRGNSPTTDYIDFSEMVVKYAGGIPLAINILASHFRSLYPRSIGSWETALNCLKEVSHDDIEKKLRISYDGLSKKEQAIFLDIACFFKGEPRELVEKILNGCGFSASILINSLIEKSLISPYLKMHDLVQEMGWKIVQQQSEEQPGQQSRLWIAKDAYRVLNNNKGNQKIEGIFLDMAKIDKELHLHPDVFEKMSKLRLLKIYNVRGKKVYLRQDLQSLPLTLRYLHWEEYPSKRLPSNFDTQELVIMNMPRNQFEQLEVQDFDNLMSIDLTHSSSLIQFPDFSHAPKLENINLSYCNKLESIPDRTFTLATLTNLNLRGFANLNTLPMTITTSLLSLDLSSSGIMSLPSTIGSLNNLYSLSLEDCTKVTNLPSSINKLHSLKHLHLNDCSLLEEFPDLPSDIEHLDIRGTAIKEVPSSSVEDRCHLGIIMMSNCKSLKHLPTSIFKLKSLYWFDLQGCSNLKKLPEITDPMESLKRLFLDRSGIKELPPSIGHLVSIHQLTISGCENLEIVPSNISNMSMLKHLDLSNCSKVECFPTSAGFLHWDLDVLDLSYTNVTEIPANIKELSKLNKLLLKGCKNLRYLPELPLSLEYLDARGCVLLEVVSNSKRALTQEFWDHAHPTKSWDNVHLIKKYVRIEQSLFCDCWKLDEAQRHNIFIEFQLRVLRTATRFVCKVIRDLPSSIGVCLPGNEVPEWFEYRSEGSLIDIKLSPQWHNSNFLGFVFCVVGSSDSNDDCLNIICEIDLSPPGNKCIFTWGENCFHDDHMFLPTSSNSDNVYMWYNCWNFREWIDAEEASFVFSFQDWNRRKREVMKCGVHMLNRYDLEGFGLDFMTDHHLLEEPWKTDSDSDNAIPDQPESSARGAIENEPHPKRIRLCRS